MVPKTASISGAAASRSGVSTRTCEGCWSSPRASRASRWSCNTSSSRVSEWARCTSTLRSASARGQSPGAGSCSVSTELCRRASRLWPGRGWNRASSLDRLGALLSMRSTRPSIMAWVWRPQVASRRWPTSWCAASGARPRAVRWLRRRGSISSNQYSWQGFSTYRCTCTRRAMCCSQCMCRAGMLGRAKMCSVAGRPAARACSGASDCSASTKAVPVASRACSLPAARRRHKAACQAASARCCGLARGSATG